MFNEILFTVEYKGEEKDIAVNSNIIIADLIDIVTMAFAGKSFSARLYSQNHSKVLESDKSLFEEKIWDGDILRLVK